MTEEIIDVPLTKEGIKDAIKRVKYLKKRLSKDVAYLVEMLAKEGVEIASMNFVFAQYDGDNDVVVRATKKSNTEWVVKANGNAVLFIEFGTGTSTYTDESPEPRPTGVVNRGEYGHGLGKFEWWHYDGSPGTNGELMDTGRVKTYGNPANACMYHARETLIREKLEEFGRRYLAYE